MAPPSPSAFVGGGRTRPVVRAVMPRPLIPPLPHPSHLRTLVTAPLLRIAAAMGARDQAALEAALQAADREDLAARVEEVLVQGYLFLGYPAALNGLALWRRLSGRPASAPAPDEPQEWATRGARVCQAVYGGQYEGLRENIRSLHPDMERWMVQEGYGKVLGRPGLELVCRELCIVALLAALDVPRQLHSHLRGALQVGASPEQVERAVAVAAEVGGDPGVATRSREVWDAVRTRWTQKGEE